MAMCDKNQLTLIGARTSRQYHSVFNAPMIVRGSAGHFYYSMQHIPIPLDIAKESLKIDSASPSWLTWKDRPRSHFKTDRAWKSFSSRRAGKAGGSWERGVGYGRGGAGVGEEVNVLRIAAGVGTAQDVFRRMIGVIHEPELFSLVPSDSERAISAGGGKLASVQPACHGVVGKRRVVVLVFDINRRDIRRANAAARARW